MIFSLTDIVISGTLFLNALTLVSSKSSNIEQLETELELNMISRESASSLGGMGTSPRNMEEDKLLSPSSGDIGGEDEEQQEGGYGHGQGERQTTFSQMYNVYISIFGHNSAIMLQIRRIMVTIRLNSFIIALWDILFILLMLFVFR
jgi:hypothetical protein